MMTPNMIWRMMSFMPMQARVGGGILGGSFVIYMIYAFFGTNGMLIFLIGVAIVGLIVWAYSRLLRKLRAGKEKGFSQDVKGQAAATPQTLSKAEQIAKLDDLRKKFEDGLETFRAAGKNIYSLPWYMLMGEPGSGKTEAIRHSNIGFPPGLQDQLQGVGGTINMNWWFTNDAIILDLAGRLVFEDVQAGLGSEWALFLKLLRQKRPNCPVNGLVLVIPADSLIKDPPDAIQRKAAKLSSQLALIQRTLDIRFPVFTVITKCDLITGFKEFFDDLNTPEQQYQMIGWSNPESIDKPFDPEETERYLDKVEERLMRRRFHLLQNPEPSQDLSDSRFDEVDSLYLFPQNFRKIIAPLKCYLQSLFVSSEWSSKPLFLRGIYLTSSMQQGAALDLELAKALGQPLDALPEGRIWEKERSFFLRDVFINKIFGESGLVTRATNVTHLYRRRRAILLGAGIAAVLVLLGLTWFGANTLSRSIGKERDLWVYAADRLEKPVAGQAFPAVRRAEDGTAHWMYEGTRALQVGSRRISVAEYQEDLQARVLEPIRIPGIFRLSRLFDRDLNARRREARRVVFDLGVLAPVVNATRGRMQTMEDDAWSPGATEALGELIRIEADARANLLYASRDRAAHRLRLAAMIPVACARAEADGYLARDGVLFERILGWSYESHPAGGGVWPPGWLAGGALLSTNRTLEAGLERFLAWCVSSEDARDLERQREAIRLLWGRLIEFEGNMGGYARAEQAFAQFLESHLDGMRRLRGFETAADEWRERYAELERAMQTLHDEFAGLRAGYESLALSQTGQDLESAYRDAVARLLQQAEARMATLPLPDEARPDAADGTAAPPSDAFLREIRDRMAAALEALNAAHPPSTFQQLGEFAADYGRIDAIVRAAERSHAMYKPVEIPERLRAQDQSWAQWRRFMDLGRNLVSDDHDELERVCRRIDGAFREYGQRFTNLQSRCAGIVQRAHAGLENIGSATFAPVMYIALRNWAELPEDPRDARQAVLAMTPAAFIDGYLVNAKTEQTDFTAQYWQDRICEALAALTTESWADAGPLEPYAAFPLTLPGPAVLSRAQYDQAARRLREMRTATLASDGQTLGDGAHTRVEQVDEHLALLRAVRLSDPVNQWIAAALAVIDALPAENAPPFACTVRMPSEETQMRLLQRHGKQTDDGVSSELRYMRMTQGPGSPRRVVRTSVAAPDLVGEAQYPGREDLRFEFYEFWSPTAAAAPPDATVLFEGPWALLRLLHDPYAGPMDETGRTWVVPIVARGAARRERYVWIELEFERPLPPIAEWPRRPESFR